MFLTSSVGCVAQDVVKHIPNPSSLKLIFITTPVEVEEGDLSWLDKDKKELTDCGFDISYYTITNKTKNEIKEEFDKYNVMYVSGGNPFYLLEKIQQTDSANLFRDFVKQGKIYIGTSAGSMIVGPDIFPTYRSAKAEKAPNLRDYKGLGLVNFVIFPHWRVGDFADKYLPRLEHAFKNSKDPLIVLNDNQYIIVEDEFYKIVDTTE